MGKKSGRSVNPADQQRKLDRKRELKRNKKQRVETREAVVRSRDPEEVIEQLRHVDEQIYDPDKHIKDVLEAKRKKLYGQYISIISLHRAQKDTGKVKELQDLLNSYETERRDMEERYNAVTFAREGKLDIPLPSGFCAPDDAMTPASMIPVPPAAPKIHSGILKRPVVRKLRRTPPGPPCIAPPEYDDYAECPQFVLAGPQNRRVKFSEAVVEEVIDDDYEPVEIPIELQNGGLPSIGQMFPPIMSMPHAIRPAPPLLSRPNPGAIISAPAQVVMPTVDVVAASQPVISAGPQMRDLWKETTRFIPTAITANKKQPQKPRTFINYSQVPTTTAPPSAPIVGSKPSSVDKSKDQICDDFLASLGDLL